MSSNASSHMSWCTGAPCSEEISSISRTQSASNKLKRSSEISCCAREDRLDLLLRRMAGCESVSILHSSTEQEVETERSSAHHKDCACFFSWTRCLGNPVFKFLKSNRQMQQWRPAVAITNNLDPTGKVIVLNQNVFSLWNTLNPLCPLIHPINYSWIEKLHLTAL